MLERSGLVARTRVSRARPCRLRAEPLREVADWVGEYRRFWAERLDRLDGYLRELQGKEPRHGKTEAN